MFNKSKDIQDLLLKENKRLKRENQRLQESLYELQEYKDEYKMLTEDIKVVKENYIQKMKDFDALEREYRRALDEIIRNKVIN